ncbi:Bug family tripartite tricarboxylate transporter substrate binding protein [Phreatobacter stygius]|uniref:Tripartite tricarboxylate transporter substrate binding protein n=1 Tax=Phreatobacter stygius TaxID=1940610 RepID=A0A4D7BIB3_9HYPH|nr:tripartite tricarboxylate transporter substrate binding protein [Phreatobacter stygius]QCI67537.1 tripartite tricarboxylate transporter substrate binding protein [Phreatobacter stygius]
MDRRDFLKIAGAGALALPGSAQAQAYPSRGVTMVVPHAAGGPVDVVARLVAQGLDGELKQGFVVENRAGASGVVGANYVTKQPADGYTLYFNASIHIVNPLTRKEPAGFDVIKDFTPIYKVARGPVVFSVPPSLGVDTLAQFIAKAKAEPAKMNFAISGFGSAGHMMTELFRLRSGVQLPFVLYRGGGPAVNDLIAGHVSAFIDPILSALPQIRGGRVKALAIGSKTRSPHLPDVPTFAELGYPGLDLETWYGVWGPAGLPAPVVATLEGAIAKVVASEGFKSRLGDLGFEPENLGSQAFAAFISAEYARYVALVAEAKIEPQ